MYFSTLDETDENRCRIGIAESEDLEKWEFKGAPQLR